MQVGVYNEKIKASRALGERRFLLFAAIFVHSFPFIETLTLKSITCCAPQCARENSISPHRRQGRVRAGSRGICLPCTRTKVCSHGEMNPREDAWPCRDEDRRRKLRTESHGRRRDGTHRGIAS